MGDLHRNFGGLKAAKRLCRGRPSGWRAGLKSGTYKTVWRVMREPGWMPKPFPPRGTPLGKTPLPLEGRGAGPLAPPPGTAIGGLPKETGLDGSDPMDWDIATQSGLCFA